MDDVVLLAHGAGSSPEAARRLLGPCIPEHAVVEAPELRHGVEDAASVLTSLAHGRRVVLAAGLSLGAHAVALWAGRSGDDAPLVLAMPAWTDDPDVVATLTAAAADDVADRGSDAVLRSLRDDPALREDWVLDELAHAWPAYGDAALVSALREAARSPGPGTALLAALRSPVAVVALADDPLHPEAVARTWAATIPRAALRLVARQAPLEDRGALGRAAADALAEVSGSR